MGNLLCGNLSPLKYFRKLLAKRIDPVTQLLAWYRYKWWCITYSSMQSIHILMIHTIYINLSDIADFICWLQRFYCHWLPFETGTNLPRQLSTTTVMVRQNWSPTWHCRIHQECRESKTSSHVVAVQVLRKLKSDTHMKWFSSSTMYVANIIRYWLESIQCSCYTCCSPVSSPGLIIIWKW